MTHHCTLCAQPMSYDGGLCTTCAYDIWRAKCDTDQEAS